MENIPTAWLAWQGDASPFALSLACFLQPIFQCCQLLADLLVHQHPPLVLTDEFPSARGSAKQDTVLQLVDGNLFNVPALAYLRHSTGDTSLCYLCFSFLGPLTLPLSCLRRGHQDLKDISVLLTNSSMFLCVVLVILGCMFSSLSIRDPGNL